MHIFCVYRENEVFKFFAIFFRKFWTGVQGGVLLLEYRGKKKEKAEMRKKRNTFGSLARAFLMRRQTVRLTGGAQYRRSRGTFSKKSVSQNIFSGLRPGLKKC